MILPPGAEFLETFFQVKIEETVTGDSSPHPMSVRITVDTVTAVELLILILLQIRHKTFFYSWGQLISD